MIHSCVYSLIHNKISFQYFLLLFLFNSHCIIIITTTASFITISWTARSGEEEEKMERISLSSLVPVSHLSSQFLFVDSTSWSYFLSNCSFFLDLWWCFSFSFFESISLLFHVQSVSSKVSFFLSFRIPVTSAHLQSDHKLRHFPETTPFTTKSVSLMRSWDCDFCFVSSWFTSLGVSFNPEIILLRLIRWPQTNTIWVSHETTSLMRFVLSCHRLFYLKKQFIQSDYRDTGWEWIDWFRGESVNGLKWISSALMPSIESLFLALYWININNIYRKELLQTINRVK